MLNEILKNKNDILRNIQLNTNDYNGSHFLTNNFYLRNDISDNRKKALKDIELEELKLRLNDLKFKFEQSEEEIIDYTKNNINDDLDLYSNNENCFVFVSVALKYSDVDLEIRHNNSTSKDIELYNQLGLLNLEYRGNTRDKETLDVFYNVIKDNEFNIGLHSNDLVKFCFIKR